MTLLLPHDLGIPVPQPTVTSQAFWDGCAAGELRYQRCRACDRAVFDPSPICRWCASSDLEWLASEGLGHIYTWTVIWRPASPAFASPVAVAIIDIDEGFQILANVIGCGPDELAMRQRVAVEFHPIGGGIDLPYFRPVPPELH